MTTEATGVRSICSNCGANLAWDAAAGALRCASCGATEAPPPDGSHPRDGMVVEHDLFAALRRTKPRWHLGQAAKQVKCNECGAIVEFPDGIVATKCSFCDSPHVLAQEARADLIAPESLVPFAIDRGAAVTSFKTWLGGLWFRPSDLRSKADISELRGVYVPFWTFDCEVTSHWTADAGYHYYVNESYTTTENGRRVTRTRRVQRTRWEPASGTRHDSYDDWLVCASQGVPGDLVDRMDDFDTGGLVAYAPQYLQGFLAESYALDLRAAWERGRAGIGESQVGRCASDVPGDTHRDLRASHQFADATFKHVLLPIWIAAFRYRGKVYRFLVNGQTGRVAGKAPWSVFKIAALVVVLVAVAVGVFLLLRGRSG